MSSLYVVSVIRINFDNIMILSILEIFSNFSTLLAKNCFANFAVINSLNCANEIIKRNLFKNKNYRRVLEIL